ncbi:MAG: NADH-quinone oxidoreductase subunit NuoK [Candidatus Eisenbacteria bacterium]|nr:NADH-quinone oxidoreductase subunit NuoK [Candidatus Eisenbacteria bacterium]
MVPTEYYLILSAALFSLGVLGFLVRRNAIVVFMAVELMLNAVNIALVAFSRHFGVSDGQIIVLFVMVVAAAEAALGLAIIVVLFRRRRTVDVDSASEMKW